MRYSIWILALVLFTASACAQTVPAVYTHIEQDTEGRFYVDVEGEKVYEVTDSADFRLDELAQLPTGTETGLAFDFGKGFKGKIFYGFIPYEDAKLPLPVWFKSVAKIVDGKAEVNIKDRMSGRYDMIHWEEKGAGVLAFRVVNGWGKFCYDGRVAFSGTGPFKVVPTVVEGPFVNRVTPTSVTISYTTNLDEVTKVQLWQDGKEVATVSAGSTSHHEAKFENLKPGQSYTYKVLSGGQEFTYGCQTSPQPGSRNAWSFAYASDARAGLGGGERSIHGANAFIMKRIMALSHQRNVAFAQFSGDLVGGYLSDREEMNLQYANWKRSLEPWASYFPVYVSFGNHEMFGKLFANEDRSKVYMVDGFPFAEESGEKLFADNFVLPQNGPISEDGSRYDPNPNQTDFPSYDENVYSYTYDNTAVIVLNSNYLFTPGRSSVALLGGGLHAYIMDNQLAWLKQELDRFENDTNIDHIFVTQHTPCFPNGGHVGDDMWYSGNNEHRPVIAGKPVEKGIIERRDEILDLLINKNTKVRAILTGDEHNYCRTEIGPETNIYPDGWELEKLTLKRTIWQVNNGAAGAPYYAQEQTPWTEKTFGFTTLNAVVFFNIEGEKLELEVYNPDTLEEVDKLELKSGK